MVDDVMIEPAGKPSHNRVFGGVVGCGGKDVVHAVVKLAAVERKVGAVDGVGGLEDERYAQTHDQMHQKKRARDQQRRFSQYQDGQDQHVGEVEAFPGKEDDVFAQRMPGAPQVLVSGEKKALKVAEEHVVEGKHGVDKKSVDVLKAVPWRPRFMGRKPEDAAAGKRIVFAVEIYTGVVTAMMEDSPHVRVDAAKIEDIVERLVHVRPG